MKWLVVLVVSASVPAWADRCADGVAAMQKRDLTHAAIWLDGCDDGADVARAKRELQHELDASNLAVVEVISRPQGLEASIDALPGEHFTTPVKLYVAPGKHVITVGEQKVEVDAKPHTRAPVYVDAKVAPVNAPRTGTVDFNEDSGGEATQETAPPPDQKHPPLTPCKYSNSCTEAGTPIDDPLAEHESPPPAFPEASIELRGGTAYVNALAPSVAIAAKIARGDELPWLGSVRVDWSRRGGNDAFGGTFAVEKVVAAPDTAWLSLGAGALYNSYAGLGGVALVELALRRLPVSVGARYEQGIATMMDGTREHALILELGIGWRITR